ncbi:MAG: hypothetical protein KAH05_07085, partial [Clostridiales bacterium]|nr:hypothetical protein [Clostridiales bacterium]
MKCKLCDKYYIVDLKFYNLFNPSELCETCNLEYIPHVYQESIPISNGLVTYYYLYDDIQLNIKQEEYLEKNFRIFYDKIESKTKSIILFIDSRSIKVLSKYFPV